jgi:hypothetical protein
MKRMIFSGHSTSRRTLFEKAFEIHLTAAFSSLLANATTVAPEESNSHTERRKRPGRPQLW